MRAERELRWQGSSLEDLRGFPEDVQDVMGFALSEVQLGRTPLAAKVMHGLGSGVWEIRDSFQGDAFRAVYVVRFEDAVYVLHCFEKKSHRGSETPREDMRVIEARLKAVEAAQRELAKRRKKES